MKTIIAGSRSVTRYEDVVDAIYKAKFVITEVVSGTAKGVDSLGEEWAFINKIPIKKFPPDWKTFGRAAGIMRNMEMGRYADALIAVWDGKSKGTEHMIRWSIKNGLKVYVKEIINEE